MKKIIMICLVVLCFSFPVFADDNPAEEPSVGLKVVDAVFVRPPCVAISMASTLAFCAIAVPAYIIGIADPLAMAMVDAPWRFTAERHLGEFNHYRDEKNALGKEWKD